MLINLIHVIGKLVLFIDIHSLEHYRLLIRLLTHVNQTIQNCQNDFFNLITQPGLLKRIEEKIEKVGDVVQEKLEAAGNFIETEWNKHNFGPVLVRN